MGNYKFKINGKAYDVTVGAIADGNASVTVNGTEYKVELESGISSPAAPAATAREPEQSQKAEPKVAGAGKSINSPLPGTIIEVCVKEGQAVKKGQKIVVLEAMKMENEIQAESDGTVTALMVKNGDTVLEGAQIATIA